MQSGILTGKGTTDIIFIARQLRIIFVEDNAHGCARDVVEFEKLQDGTGFQCERCVVVLESWLC